MYVATIELDGVNDDHIVLSDSDEAFGDEGMELDVSPKGVFSTAFKTRTESGAFTLGGRIVGEEVPIREVTMGINLFDMGSGIEDTIERFRRLWAVPGTRQRKMSTRFTYSTDHSGSRWLDLRLAQELSFSPEKDWNLQGFARVVVSAIAVQPMYESDADVRSWANPSAGTHSGYIPAWNPTDQDLFFAWAFDPATEWRFGDPGSGSTAGGTSWDNEWYYKRSPGADALRWIITPSLTQTLYVNADPFKRTYRSADGSDASGLFGGVEPLYWLPPHTGTEADPVMVPVQCNGPAGARATLKMRRLWSTEAGGE